MCYLLLAVACSSCAPVKKSVFRWRKPKKASRMLSMEPDCQVLDWVHQKTGSPNHKDAQITNHKSKQRSSESVLVFKHLKHLLERTLFVRILATEFWLQNSDLSKIQDSHVSQHFTSTRLISSPISYTLPNLQNQSKSFESWSHFCQFDGHTWSHMYTPHAHLMTRLLCNIQQDSIESLITPLHEALTSFGSQKHQKISN